MRAGRIQNSRKHAEAPPMPSRGGAAAADGEPQNRPTRTHRKVRWQRETRVNIGKAETAVCGKEGKGLVEGT